MYNDRMCLIHVEIAPLLMYARANFKNTHNTKYNNTKGPIVEWHHAHYEFQMPARAFIFR